MGESPYPGSVSGPSRELVEKARKAVNERVDAPVLLHASEGKPHAEEALAEAVLSSVWSSLVEEARAEVRELAEQDPLSDHSRLEAQSRRAYEAEEENERLRELLRRCYRVVGPDDLATDIEAALAGSEAAPPECDPTAGLPDDLVRILRDQSLTVPQHAAVFEVIAKWANAPTDTPSASPDPAEHERGGLS